MRAASIFLRVAAVALGALIALNGCQSAPKKPLIEAAPAESANSKEKTRRYPIIHFAPAPIEARSGSGMLLDAENLFDKGAYLAAYRRYIESAYMGDLTPRTRAYSLYRAGLALFNTGRYREAAEIFEKATEIESDDSETRLAARINLGICHYLLDESQSARAQFDEAAAETPPRRMMSHIDYYRALLESEDRKYYESARRYISLVDTAADAEISARAKSNYEDLVRNFLGEPELETITRLDAGSWAAKTAFLELIERHKRQNNETALEEAKLNYAAQFESNGKNGAEPSAARACSNKEIERARLGAILPLTGSGAGIGRSIARGIELALDEYHDFMRARGLDLVIKDSTSNPEDAAAAAADLARDERIVAVVGPVFSQSMVAARQVSLENCLTFLSPSAAREGLTSLSPYFFRNAVIDSLEARRLGELAIDEMGLKSFAIFYPNTASGARMSAYFKFVVESKGGQVLAVEPYKPEATDFSHQVRAIGGMRDSTIKKIILDLVKRNEGLSPEEINTLLIDQFKSKLTAPRITRYSPAEALSSGSFSVGLTEKYDAIFVIGEPRATGLIFPHLSFYNLNQAYRFASRSSNSPEFIATGGDGVEGVMIVDGFSVESTRAPTRAFLAAHKSAFGENPTRLTAQSYDATRLLIRAISEGARSRESVREWLANSRLYDGAAGAMTFTETGEALKELFYVQVRRGRFVEFDKNNPPIRPDRTQNR